MVAISWPRKLPVRRTYLTETNKTSHIKTQQDHSPPTQRQPNPILPSTNDEKHRSRLTKISCSCILERDMRKVSFPQFRQRWTSRFKSKIKRSKSPQKMSRSRQGSEETEIADRQGKDAEPYWQPEKCTPRGSRSTWEVAESEKIVIHDMR